MALVAVECHCAVDLIFLDQIWTRKFGNVQRNRMGVVDKIREKLQGNEQLANCVFILLFNSADGGNAADVNSADGGNEADVNSADGGNAADVMNTGIAGKDTDAVLQAVDDAVTRCLKDNDFAALEAAAALLKEAKTKALAGLNDATSRSNADLREAVVEVQKLCLNDTDDLKSAAAKLVDAKQKAIGALKDASSSKDIGALRKALEDAQQLRLCDSSEFDSAASALKDALGEAKKNALDALKMGAEKSDVPELCKAMAEAEKFGLQNTPEYEDAKAAFQTLKEEVARALAALAKAATGTDIDDLLQAMRQAKKLGLDDTPEYQDAVVALNKAKANNQEALRDAAAAKDVDRLLAAIQEGQALGSEETSEFQVAVGALDELKKNALDALKAATENEDPQELSRAIAEAEKLGLQSTSEYEAAKDTMQELKDRALQGLKDATAYKDANLLLASIVEAQKLGLSDSPEYAAALAALGNVQEEALESLKEVHPWDVDGLKAAIALAKKVDLEKTAEYEAACAMLKEAETKALAALKDVSAGDDAAALVAALGKAESLGLEKTPEYAAGVSALEQLKERTLDALKDATTNGDLDALGSAINQAEKLRMSGSGELQDAQAAWKEAQDKAFSDLQDAKDGDIDKLQNVVDRAQKLGHSGTPEFQAAASALQTAKEKAAADDEAKQKQEKEAAEEKARIELLRRLFDACDKEQIGKISEKGLLLGLSEQAQLRSDLGFPTDPKPAFFEDLFLEAVSEEDPVVTFDQFRAFYQNMTGGMKNMPFGWDEVDALLRAFFDTCDKDKSGTISKPEFLKGLWDSDEAQRLFNFPSQMESDDLDKLWRIMDADLSGEISYEELHQYYVSYWRANAKLAAEGGTCSFAENLAKMDSSIELRTKKKAQGTGDGVDDDELPDPAVLLMRNWSVSSRHVYDDNLQKFDENLLKAERALGNLQKMRLDAIKAKTNKNELFRALPLIADAIDTLNKGVGGNHDFLTAAFQHTDRLKRLKDALTGPRGFDEEPDVWCVRALMKQDPEIASSGMNTKALARLIKNFRAVEKVSTDKRGSRASVSVRSIEESGVNYEENKALAALKAAQLRKTFTGQAQSMFDQYVHLLDENVPLAQHICEELVNTGKSERNTIKTRKKSVELMEKLTHIRDALGHLAHGDQASLTSAFGGTHKRVAKLQKLLTGGSSLDEAPTAGVLLLVQQDQELFGQHSYQMIIEGLKNSFRAAAGVASDHEQVGRKLSEHVGPPTASSSFHERCQAEVVCMTLDGVSHKRVVEDEGLTAALKDTVTNTVGSLFEGKIDKESVSTTLSDDKGALKLTITISIPDTIDEAAAQKKIASSLQPELFEKVKSLPGIA